MTRDVVAGVLTVLLALGAIAIQVGDLYFVLSTLIIVLGPPLLLILLAGMFYSPENR